MDRPETDNKQHEHEPAHAQEWNIIVNTRPKKVATDELSFQAVVALAYPNPPAGVRSYTVTYRHGREQGALAEGAIVCVQNGMIFDVTPTVRS